MRECESKTHTLTHLHTHTGKGRDSKDKNDARKGYRMSLILLQSFDYLMVVVAWLLLRVLITITFEKCLRKRLL